MPLFHLTVRKVVAFTSEVLVEAATYAEAVDEINARLFDEGWDAVTEDDEGELESSEASVEELHADRDPVPSPDDDDEPAPRPASGSWYSNRPR